jgi:hypothetical protein
MNGSQSQTLTGPSPSPQGSRSTQPSHAVQQPQAQSPPQAQDIRLTTSNVNNNFHNNGAVLNSNKRTSQPRIGAGSNGLVFAAPVNAVSSQQQHQGNLCLTGSTIQPPGNTTNATPSPLQQSSNAFVGSTEFWNQQITMPAQPANGQAGLPLPPQMVNHVGGQLMAYQHPMQGGPPHSIQFVNQMFEGNVNQIPQIPAVGQSNAPPESANASTIGSQAPMPQSVNANNSASSQLQLNFSKATAAHNINRAQSAQSSTPSNNGFSSASIPLQGQHSSMPQQIRGNIPNPNAFSMSPFTNAPLGYAILPGPVDLNPIGAQNLSVALTPSPYNCYAQVNSLGQTFSLAPSPTQGQMNVNHSSNSSVMLESANSGIGSDAAGAAGRETFELRHKQLRERNNREQNRAQKLSTLIDSLRSSMTEGGWKLEVKSKSSTLEQSKTYIEHLLEINKEKESKVKEARKKLEEVQIRARERESAKLQSAAGGGSDPESVMSSLTSDSASADRRSLVMGTRRGCRSKSRETNKSTSANADDQVKLSFPVISTTNSKCMSRSDSVDSSKSSGYKSCKPKKDASDAQCSSAECGNGQKKLAANYEGRPDSIDTDILSLSRMSDVTSVKKETDSIIAIAPGANSAGGVGGGGSGGTTVARSSSREDASIVVPEIQVINRKRSHAHHKRRGRAKFGKLPQGSREEAISSLDEEFQLNYREVFLMSNVPQLIANITGRIVGCKYFVVSSLLATPTCSCLFLTEFMLHFCCLSLLQGIIFLQQLAV